MTGVVIWFPTALSVAERVTAVLLAEDDEAIAAPLSRALGREGYEVTIEPPVPVRSNKRSPETTSC